ncbi:hypothetical protein MNEG_10434, partial [Monoraphidium neglectum]
MVVASTDSKAMADASRAVGAVMQHYHRALAAAPDPRAAAAAVAAVLAAFVAAADAPPPDSAAQHSSGGLELPPQLQKVLEQSAAAYGREQLRAAFFAHHFEPWATAALT